MPAGASCAAPPGETRGVDLEDRRLARQRSYPRSDVIFLKKIEKSSCCDEIRSFAYMLRRWIRTVPTDI
ncbi:MAG: hypothetical protein V3V55_01040, partial [Rhodospirillales bacterium]